MGKDGDGEGHFWRDTRLDTHGQKTLNTPGRLALKDTLRENVHEDISFWIIGCRLLGRPSIRGNTTAPLKPWQVLTYRSGYALQLGYTYD